MLRALESTALLAVIAGTGGCLVTVALHDIPLLLPIVIGGAVGLLVRGLAFVVRSLYAFVRGDLDPL